MDEDNKDLNRYNYDLTDEQVIDIYKLFHLTPNNAVVISQLDEKDGHKSYKVIKMDKLKTSDRSVNGVQSEEE